MEVYSDRQTVITRTPWWVVSILFHASVILMAGMFIMAEADIEDPFEVVKVDISPQITPKQEETVKRDIVERDTFFEYEELADMAVPVEEELPIEDELEEFVDPEDTTSNIAGNEALANADNLEGQWDFSPLGVNNSGDPGDFGPRGDPSGKRDAIKRWGSRKTAKSVDASLKWLERHQGPDGSWSFDKYWKHCSNPVSCQHLDIEKEEDSWSCHNWDNSATAFALLCYLSDGHTHKAGLFKKQVADGLNYLRVSQAENGSFSKSNYVHAITTMAVVEAYGMTRASELKEMSVKAIQVILDRQNEEGYSGWGYRNPSSRSDTSVTGWQIMALKSAKTSGLDIGKAFDGAKLFLDKVTPKVVGGSEPKLDGHVAYTYYSDKDEPGHRGVTLTAIGLLCRVFMGQRINSALVQAHASAMLEHMPKRFEDLNFYQLYYATYAMFQMGDEGWKQWNEAMKNILVNNQRIGGCEDGSWDPSTSFSSQQAGRLFTTVAGCLSLEVYYRYYKQKNLAKR